jgi:hypothetical protein
LDRLIYQRENQDCAKGDPEEGNPWPPPGAQRPNHQHKKDAEFHQVDGDLQVVMEETVVPAMGAGKKEGLRLGREQQYKNCPRS